MGEGLGRGLLLSFPGMYGGFYQELNNPMFRTPPLLPEGNRLQGPDRLWMDGCNCQYWRGAGANMFQYVGTNALLGFDFNEMSRPRDFLFCLPSGMFPERLRREPNS